MSLNFDSSIGNRAFVYKNYPEAESASSQDIFECTSIGPCIPSGSLESGQILCKAEFISIMPLARAHLDLKNNDNGAEDLGLNRTRLGDIAAGESILKVILSNSKNYKADEYVYVGGNVTEYKLLWDDGRDSSYNVPPIKVTNQAYPYLVIMPLHSTLKQKYSLINHVVSEMIFYIYVNI